MVALSLQQQPLLIKLPNGQLVPTDGALPQSQAAPIAGADLNGMGGMASTASGNSPAAAIPQANVVAMNSGHGGAARAPDVVAQRPPASPQMPDAQSGVDLSGLLAAIAKGAGASSVPATPPPPSSTPTPAPATAPAAPSSDASSLSPPPAPPASGGLLDHLRSVFLGSSGSGAQPAPQPSTTAPPAAPAAAPAPSGALPAQAPGFFDRLQSNPLAMALLTGGLSTMSAASRPGATIGGSLGEGGLAGIQTVFQQKAAQRQAQIDAQKAASEQALQAAQANSQNANAAVGNAQAAAIPLTTAADVKRTGAETDQANATTLLTKGEAAVLPAKAAAEVNLQRAQAAQAAAQAAAIPEEAARNRWSLPSPGMGVDPATNKQVPGSYVTDRDTGTQVFHPGVVITGKPGGGGQGGGVSQWRYNAYLAIHPNDTVGALDYSAGHKSMTPGDADKAAYNIATQELRAMVTPPPDTSSWIDKRAADLKTKLLSAAPPPATAPPASAPAGAIPLPPMQQRVPGQTKVPLPNGKKATWTQQGWVVDGGP